MLFDKNIDPCCAYCGSGTQISPTEVMCLRRGIVDISGFCSKFDYDPLKREPPRHAMLKVSGYSQEDFEL